MRGSGLASGSAIATFNADGTYGNHNDGRSHAAIFLMETHEGLSVTDAWIGRPAGERIIRFRGGAGQPVDDGDAYHAVVVSAA